MTKAQAGGYKSRRLTGFLLPIFDYQENVTFYGRIGGNLVGAAFELQVIKSPGGQAHVVAVQPYGDAIVNRSGRQYRLKLSGSPVRDRLFDLTIELQEVAAARARPQARTPRRITR